MKTLLRLTLTTFVLAALNLSTAVVQAQFSYTTDNRTITQRLGGHLVWVDGA